MAKKGGQKIRAWVDPPPLIRAMPERKYFFLLTSSLTLTAVVKKRNARKPVAPAGREGRWVGAISANACGPNISWPRALGPHHHHHHHHLGAARPDQSGPCSGSSVAAQRASWSSPEIASDPDIQLFCFVLPCLVSRGIAGRWLLCSER